MELKFQYYDYLFIDNTNNYTRQFLFITIKKVGDLFTNVSIIYDIIIISFDMIETMKKKNSYRNN